MKGSQKPDHVSLASMVSRLREGRYVIPDFQRDFEGGDGRTDIVLDGQQRLTAMYYAFMAPDKPAPPNAATDISISSE